MYYVIRDVECKKKFKFLYNDEDKSVKYVSPAYIKSLGKSSVKVNEDIDYDASSDKYKVLFEQVPNQGLWVKNICLYSVGDFHIRMRFGCFNGSGEVDLFYIGSGKNKTKKRVASEIDKCMQAFGFDGGFGGDNYLEIVIPIPMLDYLMHLVSQHDFDGIMDAFSDYMGVELYKFVPNISSDEVKFDEWLV